MTSKNLAVNDYISKCSKEVIPLLNELREFVHETMTDSTEGMQYGTPVFMNANGVAVIYLYCSKHHVNFGFLKSSELLDPDSILEGSGKPSKHIKVFAGKPYDKTLLSEFIGQCENLQP